jgi:5'-3' exonuclease
MLDMNITKDPIILIDCSYYIFYRYFATKKWITFQKDNENIDFIESFEKHFDNDMKKLCKKFKTQKQHIYFGVDCIRNTIWRNEYHDSYKKHRIDNPDFDRDIFDYFKSTIAINHKLKLISSNNLEADDVIALIHNRIKDKTNTIIITNDSDYVQLKDNNTTIINMQLKDITLKYNINHYTIYKALVGDKSDNIKRVGKITKIQASNLITKSLSDIELWLTDNNLLTEFNNNMKLIDFKYIPEELVNNLFKNINIKMI